jgi:hypothetical protein
MKNISEVIEPVNGVRGAAWGFQREKMLQGIPKLIICHPELSEGFRCLELLDSSLYMKMSRQHPRQRSIRRRRYYIFFPSW